MTRSQVKQRLALAWWQYLAVGLVPLPVMAWAFGGGDALIPVLAMHGEDREGSREFRGGDKDDGHVVLLKK